jgi:hypothetical protein
MLKQPFSAKQTTSTREFVRDAEPSLSSSSPEPESSKQEKSAKKKSSSKKRIKKSNLLRFHYTETIEQPELDLDDLKLPAPPVLGSVHIKTVPQSDLIPKLDEVKNVEVRALYKMGIIEREIIRLREIVTAALPKTERLLVEFEGQELEMIPGAEIAEMVEIIEPERGEAVLDEVLFESKNSVIFLLKK